MRLQSNHFLGRFAAIDIGTVTCRMLIADASMDGDGRYKVTPVDKQYAITNLGENVDKTGFISDAALTRVRQTIERYLEIIATLSKGASSDQMPVQKVIAMSTSAARDAKNSAEFIAMLESLGVDLKIISGDREASLSFAGASLKYIGEKLVVVDVGGGSAEVSIGVGGGKPELLHSFNIGCRRVTEKFWDGYPPSAHALDTARMWVRSEIDQWVQANVSGCGMNMVAVAGTATSAVTMRDKIYPYDSSKVDGAIVSLDDMDALIDALSKMSLSEIESIRGLDPARSPVIVAGLMILREIMSAFDIASFSASESDILDAMILCAADESFCR